MNDVLDKKEVLNQDALLDKVRELESELAESKQNETMWYNNYTSVSSKFETFKNAVKSVVSLV